MSRPAQIEKFMQMDFAKTPTMIDLALQQYILSLESKLPPEPEEVWRKGEVLKNGDALFVINDKPIVWMDEPIIDEILRNRELIRRGIDVDKVWDEMEKTEAGVPTVLQRKQIRSLIEAQLKRGE